MLISLNWIRDYVDLPADLDPHLLAERFTRTTAEVDSVHAITVAAKNLGITPKLLSRWKGEHQQHRDAGFPGQGHQMPEHAELRQLREENRRLRMERDILKKATAFFATHST